MLRGRLAPSVRNRGGDDGAVAVLVVIVVVAVVMPLMALVVDLGMRRLFADQSRAAADAAALAAAATAKATNGDFAQADQEARDLVKANLPVPNGGWAAAWASCSDAGALPTVVGTSSCISFDPILKHVRVTVPQRTVPTVFSGTVGVSAISASATTTATWGLDPVPTCALCVFGSYSGARKVVQVTGDGVAVGSDLSMSSPGSLTASPSPAVIRYGGNLNAPANAVSPPPQADARPFADPYASYLDAVRRMTPTGQPVYGQVSGTAPAGACGAGIYQDISSCTSFGAGVYFVTGKPNMNVSVYLNADALQVLLFFTCSRGGSGQPVVAAPCQPGMTMPRLVGTSRTISAGGQASDLAVVFDDNLTRSQRLNSSGRLTINGSVYGHDVALGGSATNTATVYGHVIVGTIGFGNPNAGSIMLQVTVSPPPAQPVPDGPVRLTGG